MSKLTIISSRNMAKVLKYLGFYEICQKGSYNNSSTWMEEIQDGRLK